jgi:hypothetical protein
MPTERSASATSLVPSFCVRYLEGHQALTNLLARSNGFAADLSYSCIRRQIKPPGCLDFIRLDAPATSVVNANVVECVGVTD